MTDYIIRGAQRSLTTYGTRHLALTFEKTREGQRSLHLIIEYPDGGLGPSPRISLDDIGIQELADVLAAAETPLTVDRDAAGWLRTSWKRTNPEQSNINNWRTQLYIAETDARHWRALIAYAEDEQSREAEAAEKAAKRERAEGIERLLKIACADATGAGSGAYAPVAERLYDAGVRAPQDATEQQP